jgi:hypothetical protein
MGPVKFFKNPGKISQKLSPYKSPVEKSSLKKILSKVGKSRKCKEVKLAVEDCLSEVSLQKPPVAETATESSSL